jgi:hypothetical protein
MADKSRKKAEDALLLALACGASVDQAARQCGLSSRTVYRRLAEADYRRRLQGLRGDMVSRTVGTLAAAASEAVRTLLDNDVDYKFLRNKAYMMENPGGRKQQYTVEQVKIALANAEGIARMALLLRLNCGWIVGDIAALHRAENDDGHISKVREKLRHKKRPLKPVWLLWPETRAALIDGVSYCRVQNAFVKLREQFQVPEHKALRKTTSQIIEGLKPEGGSDVARLF